jgi:hypothetical protein
MGQSKEVKLLKELLDRIPRLKQLNHDNDEYKSWRADVRATLEVLFGENSRELELFNFRICSIPPHESEDEKRKRYIADLDTDERKLKSFIQIQVKKEELNKVLRFKKLRKSAKEELKDYSATIIAKYLAEKTK